jgi:AraC-like DNA-binding protein
MRYDFNFYSSLLLITFSQGLLYSILLLKKGIQNEDKSSFWLSFFVFLCSIYVAPWMLGFAGWYDHQPYRNFMFYIPFQHLFLIGPIIFFYTQRLLNPAFKFDKKQFLHFIPAIIYLIYNMVIFVFDNFISEKIYFYEDGTDKDFDEWYQYSGQISMVIYFFLSIRYYNFYRKMIVQVTSNADSILFAWIKKYLIAFLIMLLLPVLFDIIGNFYQPINSYVGSWWFFLAFSLVLYYIAITGYSNGVHSKIGFEISVFDKNPTLLLAANENYSIEDQTVIDIEHEVFEQSNAPELELWKSKIENLINDEKLFQNPELTLTEVSKKLKTNASVISKTINQGFQMNFNDFVNQYRIKEVKKAFEKGEHKKSTLLGIAYDCGFNSKATFNRAFKKNTGLSPKDYLNTI